MRRFAILLCLVPPLPAIAVEPEDRSPPTPTETTLECANGKVWDEDGGKCVARKESRLDDETLYRAVREFAYSGRYHHALEALAAMADQGNDRVLAYRGDLARQTGSLDKALGFYLEALSANPDNLLARTYLGQMYVETGKYALARTELSEIRARGGRMTWPEIALREALRPGNSAAYR